MTNGHGADAQHVSRYEVVRSAAAAIAAAYQSGWDRPWPDEPATARMVNGIANRLSIAHDTAKAQAGGCLCAGCLSTHYYAEAADLTSSGLDDEAAWRQRIGDAYYVAHQVARAVGWQYPLVDTSSMLAERIEWERSPAGLAATPQRGPLPT
jgi:hypothetical protein